MSMKILSRNRLFVITAVVFVLLVTFIDKNNLVDSRELKTKIKSLEEQKKYYLEKIEEDSTILENLKNDRFLEKFARENYYMKKDGEVLYIVK